LRGLLGLVVYRWGRRSQDSLLVDCLGPLAAELWRTGQVDRFWFDRYDARGPHLFAVLGAPVDRLERLTSRLGEALNRYLAENPSLETLTPERLERLHLQTRGRRQCEVDGWPGFGANDTWEIFAHPPYGYPFGLAEPEEDEVWRLAAELALWTIERIASRVEAPGIPEAVRWTAAVDQALRAAGADPAAYWRHHASTLIAPEDPGDGSLLDALPDALEPRHLENLARLWEEAERAGGFWPDMPRLVRAALGEEENPALLREIDHAALKQQGIPVAFHLPAVLFAWRRTR
jgi:hypothetical protein